MSLKVVYENYNMLAEYTFFTNRVHICKKKYCCVFINLFVFEIVLFLRKAVGKPASFFLKCPNVYGGHDSINIWKGVSVR